MGFLYTGFSSSTLFPNVTYPLKNIPHFNSFIFPCQLSSERCSTFLTTHSQLSINIWTHSTFLHSFSPANYHLNKIPLFYTFILPCQLSSEHYSTLLPINSTTCIIYRPFCLYKSNIMFSKSTNSTYHCTVNGFMCPLTCQSKLSYIL
jgi:hypothetical protein